MGWTVYRIKDVNEAVNTTASSIVRSAAGKLELDELQSSRESMNSEIANNLQQAADVWGIDVTRTEIIDVIIDEETQAAQRQQLNAEREKENIRNTKGQKGAGNHGRRPVANPPKKRKKKLTPDSAIARKQL